MALLWDSSEKLLLPLRATRDVPSPGTQRGPDFLQDRLCPRERNASFPPVPQRPTAPRHTPLLPHYSSVGDMGTTFWERTETNRAGCHLKLRLMPPVSLVH